jgi:(1->4)-alpha-D-glucan 1-alpha-D-glucosylmutase
MSNKAKRPEEPGSRRRIPGATYRWQFNGDFTFQHACEAVDYLRELRITDLYASPLFQAGPQSTHGYDICGFDQFNPSLGGSDGFDRLAARLRELDLGLVLDMVPNHMGNDLSNRWWIDVLEHGRASPFASFFDIDWRPRNSDMSDQILLPTLGDHYGKVLESGQLELVFNDGAFAIAYFDRQFPVASHSYQELLEAVVSAMPENDEGRPVAKEVSSLIEEFQRRHAGSWTADSDRTKEQLDNWNRTSPAFAAGLNLVLSSYNGTSGQPRSFDQLHALLRRQHYRLAFWRVGSEEINYRRFFDVTELVSLRMELPLVFEACHQLVMDLLAKGVLTGLRVDHPDGLWDPKEYFRRLQAGYLLLGRDREQEEREVSEWLREQLLPLERELARQPIAQGLGHSAEAPRSDPLVQKASNPSWPLYVVAEKILTGDEGLRRDWPVHGTTGYDFLNQANGLFVNSANEKVFDRIYGEFSGNKADFKSTIYLSKKRILSHSLISELKALTHSLKQVAGRSRSSQDFTFRQLEAVLTEVIATFPVYRTYVTEETAEVVPIERSWIEQAISASRQRNPGIELVVLDFLQDLLLLRLPPDLDDEGRKLCRTFILKFQQLTGPVTAKGVEDTAFYNYNRLVSLNEVGGEPDQFGISVSKFQEYNLRKAEQWPHSMLATATHDTKRGEDVRARINTLSEMPEEWRAGLERWRQMNANKKSLVDGSPAPHPNDEYLLYQTLIGAWPMDVPASHAAQPADEFQDRIAAYMLKAIKEAKARTSWTEPNAAYEQATAEFSRKILNHELSHAFLQDFAAFQRQTAFFGVFNSLAQVLLKLASPGVPDIYQGAELWDFSLVDPDNRRPVDYGLRRRWLGELRRQWEQSAPQPRAFLQKLIAEKQTGQVKLFTIDQGLACRHRRPALFEKGDYFPLAAAGPMAEHVCAFARLRGEESVVAVVPRLVVGLTQKKELAPLGEAVWRDTRLLCPAPLPAGNYRHLFTRQEFKIAPSEASPSFLLGHLLDDFPVALLERMT